MKFAIEKNVPLIDPGKRGRRNIYPFHKMEVGDSFFSPSDADVKYNRGQSAAFAHASRYKVKFITQAVDGGVRIFRVA